MAHIRFLPSEEDTFEDFEDEIFGFGGDDDPRGAGPRTGAPHSRSEDLHHGGGAAYRRADSPADDDDAYGRQKTQPHPSERPPSRGHHFEKDQYDYQPHNRQSTRTPEDDYRVGEETRRHGDDADATEASTWSERSGRRRRYDDDDDDDERRREASSSRQDFYDDDDVDRRRRKRHESEEDRRDDGGRRRDSIDLYDEASSDFRRRDEDARRRGGEDDDDDLNDALDFKTGLGRRREDDHWQTGGTRPLFRWLARILFFVFLSAVSSVYCCY